MFAEQDMGVLCNMPLLKNTSSRGRTIMAKKAFETASRKSGGKDKSGNKKKKKIALALQGGAVHGAYTWGVLDELLQNDNIEITAVSGASSGAMNATFLAYGLASGGPDKAREMLRKLWEGVVEKGKMGPFHSTPMDRIMGNWPGMDWNPWVKLAEYMMDTVSADVWNPAQINHIKNILEEHIDFSVLQKSEDPLLFINAMNVRENRNDIFTKSALSADVVAASANLRQMMPRVTINGEDYWDGGHMENPSVTPLADHTDAPDILAIMLNPQRIDNVPTEPKAIHQRVHDVQYSVSAYKDMERIAQRNKLIANGALDPDKSGMRKVNLHCIVRDHKKEPRSHNNFNVDRDWIMTLYERGREEAREWLKANEAKIGKESSFDPMGSVVRPYGGVIGLHDDCPNDRYCTPGCDDHKDEKPARRTKSRRKNAPSPAAA